MSGLPVMPCSACIPVTLLTLNMLTVLGSPKTSCHQWPSWGAFRVPYAAMGILILLLFSVMGNPITLPIVITLLPLLTFVDSKVSKVQIYL